MPRFPWLALSVLLAREAGAQDFSDEPPQQPPPLWQELLGLRARLESLEKQVGGGAAPAEPVPLDLSEDELSSIRAGPDHVLARPWFENVDLSGYAALAFLDTGGVGTTPDGSFLVREASLFLEAEVWEDARLFTEIWVNRYLYGERFSLGELYLSLSGLLARDEQPGLGLKLGRFEIPFGEDYLRWDANETPFITFTAADPYGIDEGVELFGRLGGAHWIAALSNGNGGGADDNSSKLLTGKVYGRPCDDLYASGSVMATGSIAESVLRFGGSAITPVGADGASSAGTSPSAEVRALCWEVDARIGESRRASLALQLGQAYIDDDVAAFDRDLTWLQVTPSFRIGEDVELVLRYSAIGTYDDERGYQLEGKPVTDGEVFGYDTSVLERLSAGVRWQVNPRVAFKAEVGRDRVDLIDTAPLTAENDERLFVAFEVVGSF